MVDVPFENQENQVENNDIEIGTKAREVIDQCQSTHASDIESEDPLEQEQQLSLDPAIEARFFRSVRLFYITLVNKMLQKFPFTNVFLKDLKLLQPTHRLDVTAQVACRLADNLPPHVVPPDKRERLRDEFRDWQILDDSSLPSYTAGDKLDVYWGTVAQMRNSSGQFRFEYLCKLTKVLLTIPCSIYNAGGERMFSMVRKISTDFQGRIQD